MENVTQEPRGKRGKQNEEMPKIKMDGPDDPDCYVVDGAVIKCDMMRDSVNEQHAQATEFYVPYGTYLEEKYPGQFRRNIRRLSAARAEGQTTGGTQFVTVKDCICQRDVDEGKAERANILSMGHCGLYEEQDREAIRENWKMAQKYGTCYCLMSLVSEWTNSRSRGIRKVRTSVDYSPSRNVMRFDTKEGPAESLKMGATLMCTRGGKITLVTSGQKRFFVPTIILDPAVWGKGQDGMDGDMTLEDAREMMAQYLRGELDEDTLNGIIPWVADNCELTVADMKKGTEFGPKEGMEGGGEAYQRSSQFDDQILAWTYYWNCKIKEEYVYDFQIDPNIVKAMIAQESSFGSNASNPNRNPTRNVMQSLSVGNDVVWIAAGINPYDNGMFSAGDDIEFKTLDGVIHTDGYLVQLNFVTHADDVQWMSEQREKYHFEDIELIGDLFEFDDNGRYRVVFDRVTTNMSIAVGIGNLAYKTESEGGNIADGVAEYNGKPGYLGKINKYLLEMGCKELH